MPLFKFKLDKLFPLVIIIFPLISMASFTDSECLQANYEAKVVQQSSFWGLFEKVLKIQKENCVLSVEQQKWKWFKKKWVVDVCRGPVHIKYGDFSVDVLRRQNSCDFSGGRGKKDPFCEGYEKLMSVIQDEGLIFAKGERDNLASDHGRVYCAYILIKGYLGLNMVLGREINYDGVLPRDEFVPQKPPPTQLFASPGASAEPAVPAPTPPTSPSMDVAPPQNSLMQ
jgi:hypothetical protein